MQDSICIYWFKRDLRLEDNEALQRAIVDKNPCLCLYIFEDIILENPHYSKRHFDFIKQSLSEINEKLKLYNTRVLVVHAEAVSFFSSLSEKYRIQSVYSHVETGLNCTYKRDLEVAEFFKLKNINWVESQNNGVKRFQKNRKLWHKNWETYMSKWLIKFKANRSDFLTQKDIGSFKSNSTWRKR
jgi:deoxyribodipyrimidine photo-lyase